jgi:Ca2+-binding EF-hand superfamily protein
MRSLARVVLATAVLALGAPALADEPGVGETPQQAMDRTDRNDDGYVDRAEFYARMSDVFYLNDDDKGGRLVEAEYVDTQIGTFASSDANGDGQVEMYEFMKETSRIYEEVDSDGDGRLSEAEVMRRYE